eukprot:2643061-Pleurochrysis_carterae.AAC.1
MVSSARRAASRSSVKSLLVSAAMSRGAAPWRVCRRLAALASFSKDSSNSRVPRFYYRQRVVTAARVPRQQLYQSERRVMRLDAPSRREVRVVQEVPLDRHRRSDVRHRKLPL